MRELLPFWPNEANLRDCLKVDAEAADPAVLLAVHQTMRLKRRDFGAASDAEYCNEEELFKALLAETGDGRVIVPIVGNSGVGKSHVIRWLDARLQHAPGHERRVIHRISKGQSLKRILSALLARPELRGVRFEPIRRQLEQARDRLSDDQAANLLCEVLAQTVKEASEEAAQKLQQANSDPLLRLQRDMGNQRVLPALLRDPVLRQLHWVERTGEAKGCIARLVEQFTSSVDADEEDTRKHQFEPDDMLLDPSVRPQELGLMSQRAVQVLQLHNPERRREVTSVLNAALDEAKKQVLGLETSISDLFDEVRKELLAEGKELVLLVEDFAVLSGMQKQLLQAIIREGFRDGRQVLCTLRTALAYTEGSASFLFDDTYRSRAKVEWLVPDAGDWSSNDLERVVRLVGAYLNAARIGVDRLQAALKEAEQAGHPPAAGRDWIPHPSRPEEGSDVAELLAAFGDVDGNALFPLNRSAIARLVEDWCRKGESIVYNPRLILQGVVLKTLERRHEFETTVFPAKDFRSERNKGSDEIARELRKHVGTNEGERCLTILAYWYGDVTTWADLEKKSPLIFKAFGLLAPWKQTSEPIDPVLPPIPPSPKPPPPRPTVDELNRWRERQKLGFERSNKIRTSIAAALEGAIEWDWYFAKPRKNVRNFHESVFIPRASGGTQNLKPADSVAVLCTEEELDDSFRGASIVGQVRAVTRYLEGKDGWEYDGAEWDAARYCALVEAARCRAANFVLQRPVKDPEDFVPTLVSGLAVSARVLGVAGADGDDHVSLIAALFARPGTRPAAGQAESGTEWAQAEGAMAQWRGSTPRTTDDNWRTALLRLVGARKGGGTPLAVDVRRLKPALDHLLETWSIVTPPANFDQFVDPAPGVASEFKLKKFDLAKCLAEESRRIAQWAGRVDEALGALDQPGAMQRVCDAVENAVRACQDAGHATMRDAEAIIVLNDEVRPLPVSELLRNARELGAAPDTGSRLRLRARHDVKVEMTLARWIDRIEMVFTRVENAIPEVPSGGVNPVALAQEALAKALESLATEFERGAEP